MRQVEILIADWIRAIEEQTIRPVTYDHRFKHPTYNVILNLAVYESKNDQAGLVLGLWGCVSIRKTHSVT